MSGPGPSPLIAPGLFLRRRPPEPDDIPGLLLWLDASDSATLYDATSGGGLVAADGVVKRWEDKSGNSRHATEATNGPIRKTAIQNGKDVLRFDRTNDRLATGAFACDTSFTAFVVACNFPVDSTQYGRIVEHGANSGWHLIRGGLDNVKDLTLGISGSSTRLEPSPRIRLPTDQDLILAEVTGDGGGTPEYTILVDGGSSNSMSNATAMSSPLAFYVNVFGGGSFYSGGDYCEIVYYDRLLTAGERTTVRGHLNNKWAIY